MQKYNKNSAGEQSVRSFFFLPLMAGSSWMLFPLIAEAVMSFISNYFAMLEFVITFVKNQSSDARLAVFTEGRTACIIRNIILTRCLSLLR